MHEVLNKLGCVGLVAALVFPFGQQVFAVIGQTVGLMPFGAAEAALSATLGRGLYATLYG